VENIKAGTIVKGPQWPEPVEIKLLLIFAAPFFPLSLEQLSHLSYCPIYPYQVKNISGTEWEETWMLIKEFTS